MKIFSKKTFLFIVFLLCFLPSISFAAEISFSSEKNIFAQNENFLIQVFLDTKGETVNAVEGTVMFSSDFLELKEIRDGNSSVNFWVEKPYIVGDGKVSFSGITAGGFLGQKIFLFGLVLRAKKAGSSSTRFDNLEVLQNNGLGTKIPITGIPFAFSISTELGSSVPENLGVVDTDLPESFNPFIGNDSTVFDGKYFLVFSTVDKGAGIDHFEIRESPWFFIGGWGGKYIIAESPYLLKDQTLKSSIYIKAIDKAGNERIVKLEAQNKLAKLGQYFIFSILLIISIWGYKLLKYRS